MNDFTKDRVNDKLIAEINNWQDKLALLRGDNIFDVSRLYFASKGLDSDKLTLKVANDPSMDLEDHDTLILGIILEKIIRPAGLRFVRTIMGRLICNEDEIIGSMANRVSTVADGEYRLLGTHSLLGYIKQMFNEIQPYIKLPSIRRITLRDRQLVGIEETVKTVPPTPNISALYPFLPFTPAELWDDFAESDANVLMMIGAPGTGKTSWFREMLIHRGYDDKIHMGTREDVLTDPGLSDYIHAMVDGSVILTEDSDPMVSERSSGNTGMSAILNASDGILSRDIKIMVSTNLDSIQRVDSALIRPGRCFDVLEFRPLTREEAYAAREALGKEFIEIAEPHLTLAAALNYSGPKKPRKTQQVFGFSR